ncbi:MAG TPA: hypothetical protein VFG83_00960 [Kofleriaceae bacterium]|nr:hypothetical protein [Kofleriaceae bacterium]
MIVSHNLFMWICTALVFGLSAAWIVVDVVRLRAALKEGSAAHDRIFGSIIGLAIATIGIIGVLRFHLGG